MRPIGLRRFQPYEGGNYAICRNAYQRKVVRRNSHEARGRVVQHHNNDRRARRPSESAKMLDWMWFHRMPADSWAVGGRFDETYVKGRKMAHARIIAPQGLMNTELKSRVVKEVARVLRPRWVLVGRKTIPGSGQCASKSTMDSGQSVRRFPRSLNSSITSALTSRSRGALKWDFQRCHNNLISEDSRALREYRRRRG
jgi:hypothetical protein